MQPDILHLAAASGICHQKYTSLSASSTWVGGLAGSGVPGHQLARLATGEEEVDWRCCWTKYWTFAAAAAAAAAVPFLPCTCPGNNKLHLFEGKTMTLILTIAFVMIIVTLTTPKYRIYTFENFWFFFGKFP